jgi:Tol biopolymer transport system component
VQEISFSPITEEIAALTEDGSLKIFSLVGNTIRRVIDGTQQKSVLGVSWSPDGRYLTYTIQNQTTFPKEHFSISLWLQEATGNSVPRLLYRSRGHEAAPLIAGWTADCRVLLFWTLHYYPAGSINLDGLPLFACTIGKPALTIRRLTGKSYRSMVLAKQEQIGFAKQGGNIAVSVGGGRLMVENKRIALVHSLTELLRFVTPARLSATRPVWSPDNEQIAYMASPAVGETYVEGANAHSASQMRLYVMNADGTKQRQLSDVRVGTTMGPRWLQDGRHLLFVRVDGNARESLWMIGAEGSGLCCLVPHISSTDDYSEVLFDLWIPSLC